MDMYSRHSSHAERPSVCLTICSCIYVYVCMRVVFRSDWIDMHVEKKSLFKTFGVVATHTRRARVNPLDSNNDADGIYPRRGPLHARPTATQRFPRVPRISNLVYSFPKCDGCPTPTMTTRSVHKDGLMIRGLVPFFFILDSHLIPTIPSL